MLPPTADHGLRLRRTILKVHTRRLASVFCSNSTLATLAITMTARANPAAMTATPTVALSTVTPVTRLAAMPVPTNFAYTGLPPLGAALAVDLSLAADSLAYCRGMVEC
jgi:hypothetical protein